MSPEENCSSAACGLAKKPEPKKYNVGDKVIVSKYGFSNSFEDMSSVTMTRNDREFYEIEIKRVLTPKVTYEDKI